MNTREWQHADIAGNALPFFTKHITLQRNLQTISSLHPSSIPTPISEPRLFDDDDEVENEEKVQSPINLRINASLKVTNSNNVICLAASPADDANAIARAVIRAMEEHSSGRCGIPMIDEDGAPRPINIEIDAGITVEGEGNLITGREVDVVRHLREQISKRDGVAVKREKSDSRESSPCRKRRQS